MDLKKTDWGGGRWTHLAQDTDRWGAVVHAVMTFVL
jgi:hypothetical protein